MGNDINIDEDGKKTVADTNFDNWNKALISKDASKVAEIYNNYPLTFLPTKLGKFIKENYGVEEYFKNFLKNNPFCEIEDERIIVLSDNCYLHTGHYNFFIGDRDYQSKIEARFSFVWKREKGKWKIIHHHSSIKPF